MTADEQRACVILQRLLLGRHDPRPWLPPADIWGDVPLTLAAAGQRFELVDIDGDDLGVDAEQTWDRVQRRRGEMGSGLPG